MKTRQELAKEMFAQTVKFEHEIARMKLSAQNLMEAETLLESASGVAIFLENFKNIGLLNAKLIEMGKDFNAQVRSELDDMKAALA